jgi:hypothetical protein
MNGFKQSFIVKWVSEECRRTTLKSLPAGRWIVVSGYADDWDSAVIRGELLLQFQPAHPGQPQVENQNNILLLERVCLEGESYRADLPPSTR